MKKDSIPSYTSTKLTAKEFLVLRSYALGMSEQQLYKLLEVSQLKFLKIKKDLMQKLALHIRKPLQQIKTISQVDKIVDPVIKKIVQKAVLKHFDGKQQISPEAFFRFGKDGSLYPKLFLPNAKGDPVPIKKGANSRSVQYKHSTKRSAKSIRHSTK